MTREFSQAARRVEFGCGGEQFVRPNQFSLDKLNLFLAKWQLKVNVELMNLVIRR